MDASTSNDKDPHCLPGGRDRGPVSAAKQPARIPGRDPPLLSPGAVMDVFVFGRLEKKVVVSRAGSTMRRGSCQLPSQLSRPDLASRHAEVQQQRQRRQRAGRAAVPVKVQPTFTLQPDARNNRNLLSASRDNSYLQSGSAEQWAITRTRRATSKTGERRGFHRGRNVPPYHRF